MPLFQSLPLHRNSNCRGGLFGDSDADIYAGNSVAFMTVRVSEGNRVAKGLGNKGETHRRSYRTIFFEAVRKYFIS